MIIDSHLKDIESRLGGEHFLRPDYTGYSFAHIPDLIRRLLGVRTAWQSSSVDKVLINTNLAPQNVILLLIDGFGYYQWRKYAQHHPFFSRLLDRGTVMPITSLFPSTTSASITTINSGLTPLEHGLIEWHLYLEELDEIIHTLPFTPLEHRDQPDLLLRQGQSPAILFNGTSLSTQLSKTGIKSYAFQQHSYAKSAYSSVMQADATIVVYNRAPDMLVHLRRQLAAANEPSYFYVYWDGIDHMSHTYEPHSEEYVAQLNGFSHLLQTEFLDKVDHATAENTVLLVTADHGHVIMKPDETIYLNQWPQVERALAKSPAGKTIYPWGNTRDVFLQVADDRLEDTIAFLSRKFEGKALVVRSQEEADRGLFGVGKEHSQFRKRIGNILILPHEDYTVWYQHPGTERKKHRGMHGGLSREEMTTVLAAANLSDLL